MIFSALAVSFVSLFPLVTSNITFTCDGPDDLATEWPPRNILINFGNTIDGDIDLPGSIFWSHSTTMKNLVYNSDFGAVVYPKSTDDIKKALTFAKEHAIRPTVYSSGHDFIGRSSGDGTFQINLSKMKQLDINTNDSSSPTGKSMTIGTGHSWIEIYTEVDKHNLVAVGGSAHTVSPGGYVLGGGHSPITRKLGLGVDQILEFTLVTADGSAVNISENGGTIERSNGSTEQLNDNGDLWWSVLGGGGGVYGIVTQFRYKLHDPPADGFVRFGLTYAIHKYGHCIGVATEALKKFLKILRENLNNLWGGYILVNGVSPDDPHKGDYYGSITLFMNRWEGDEAQARAEMQTLANFRQECQHLNDFTKYDTFLEYERTAQDAIYVRTYTFNTLIQEEDLADDNGLVDLLASVEHIPHVRTAGCTGVLVGGAGNDPSYEAKSVSPGLRTALISLTCGAGWTSEAGNAAVAQAMTEWSKRLYLYGTGVYYNEPDYFLQNWKVEYRGSMDRYNRLLRVKQQWDPDNLFWCHHCVGSDLVTYQSNSSCRTHFPAFSAATKTVALTSTHYISLLIWFCVDYLPSLRR